MSGLRVIAGKAKGKKLIVVPGDTTRPITDRTKESLFNIIGADIAGSTFLDLFAGTGAVAIEAISRGAKYACLIDINYSAVETIQKNLMITSLKPYTRVLKQNAFRYIETIQDEHYDYIYVAPPQYQDLWKKALEMIAQHDRILSPDGWVIVQIHPVEYESLSIPNLVEFDQRKYGSTLLVFYQKPV